MDNIDEIIGHEIHEITLLTWDDNVNPIRLEKICIDFGGHKLVLEVDCDFDELKYKIVNDFAIQATENEHRIIDSTTVQDFGLKELFNKRLIWLWTMINNQGFKDGLQIELDNQTTFQFMAESSAIRIKKLFDTNETSR